MRWSQKRVITAAFISIIVVLTLLSWKRNEIPNYLPADAHDYFHPPDKSNDQESKEDTALPSQDVVQQIVNRPLLTYEESVALNWMSCPTEGVATDAGTVQQNEQVWREISTTQLMEWRHEIAAHLQKMIDSEPSAPKKSGRGIVMSAGDSEAVIRARTSIRLLRSYNSTLPVEIFNFPSELSDTDKATLSELSQPEGSDGLGQKNTVTVRTVEGVDKGDGWKAFEIKGAALQQSSFDEILYLDTDSYLLRDPECLFKSKHWKETGLLLWPDYTKSHPTSPMWRLVGQQCRNEYEGESGQIVISRSRHQDVLWLAEYFAVRHNDFYGFMGGGDRDSFRAAALILGKKWAGPGRLNAIAAPEMKAEEVGGGHTMLQADPEGKWMFVHANLIKHGQFPRPLWKKIHRIAQDEYHRASTYGNADPPNDKIGQGVKVRVQQAPKLETFMETFEGYNESLITVEDWDAYEELQGFEEKWFRFGGVH